MFNNIINDNNLEGTNSAKIRECVLYGKTVTVAENSQPIVKM